MERKRPRRRGMFVLPSLFTAGNIAAGYYAITQSLQGSRLEPRHFDYAALAILFAIPFDALDGRIARMTNTTSDFGKELDSLADVITFGVAPSILAYSWGFRTLPMTIDPSIRRFLVEFGAFVCFVFLLCGASRLARFNISHDPQPKNPGRPDRKYFVGMPIPAAAWRHCLCGAPRQWHPRAVLVAGCIMDRRCRPRRISHGQHLALLERQRDQPLRTPSLSAHRVAGRPDLSACPLFRSAAVSLLLHLHVLRAWRRARPTPAQRRRKTA